MAEDKKLVEAITSMDVDFAQWYTDVCKKAELMSYSSVKGCMIFKPAGYAIWENIKNEMYRRFKETGVENVYLPMFIPESLLESRSGSSRQTSGHLIRLHRRRNRCYPDGHNCDRRSSVMLYHCRLEFP